MDLITLKCFSWGKHPLTMSNAVEDLKKGAMFVTSI
jgi:hypothetical protein